MVLSVKRCFEICGGVVEVRILIYFSFYPGGAKAHSESTTETQKDPRFEQSSL